MNSQSVSIIVTCGEQQTQLRQLLPSLLSLRYGGEYEVIVVDKMHDKDLEEWLEWLVILPVDVKLPSEDWLLDLSKCCGEEVGVVIGLTKRKSRWSWFRNIFRRPFSIFNPTSSIILCKRNILFQSKPLKLSNCHIVKL